MSPGDIVFDVETKHSFAEVGGKNNFDKLGVSVVAAYRYGDGPSTALGAGKYYTFEEHEIPEFEKLLAASNCVIGFNIHHFDLAVLKPYLSLKTKDLPTLDLMDAVEKGAGFRISLDNLAEQTLGARKSGDGMQAIRWYKEGKIDDIKKYCLKDVELTKNLSEYGVQNGKVLFYSRDVSGVVAIPVNWSKILETKKNLENNVQPTIF